MSIAVIIVNYNAGNWLLRSVQSALKESLVAEVYVVDNASVDNSLVDLKASITDEISRKLSIIENTENIGFGRANNQVLQLLVGRDDIHYALLLNPDCELSMGTLQAMLPYFQQQQDLGMASCVIKNPDGTIQATCRRNFPTPWTAFLRMSQLQRIGIGQQYNFDLGAQTLPDSYIDVEAISGAFMFVRMAAVDDVGLFDEKYFMHCEDLDWCKRFAEKGWRVGFVPQVSVLHEKGVSSKTRQIAVLWNLHQGMIRFFDKFYRDQYSLLFRSLVKTGIYLSFCARAIETFLRRVFVK